MKEVPDKMRDWAPAAKLVWWIIDDQGEVSKADLLESTGLSYDTVNHHLSSLENKELIKKTKKDTYIPIDLVL